MPVIDGGGTKVVTTALATSLANEDGEDLTMEMEMADPPVLDAVLEEEIYTVIRCAEEITRVLANADNLIVSLIVFIYFV